MANPLTGAFAKLAQFATLGLFKPTKPIEQYKPTTAQRYASSIERTGKKDRGHTNTPEHGRISAPVSVGPKATVQTTTSSQQAMRVIAAAAANGQRVSISVTDAKNPTRPISVWTNAKGGRKANGIDAKYLRDDMRRKGMNVKRYLEGTRFARHTKSGKTVGYRPRGITSIQITVY